MSQQWWPTNLKDIFSLTITLCAYAEYIGSQVIWFTWVLTKPTMQQCFHPSAKHLFYRYITPNFVGHSFRVEGETWYFFCQFTVVHFHLIKSRENHVSCRALQSNKSPGGWARELFKPSTDSASLVVETEKKMFSFSVRGFRGRTPHVRVFLATVTWPWAPTHWAIIMAQDFFGN